MLTADNKIIVRHLYEAINAVRRDIEIWKQILTELNCFCY